MKNIVIYVAGKEIAKEKVQENCADGDIERIVYRWLENNIEWEEE